MLPRSLARFALIIPFTAFAMACEHAGPSGPGAAVVGPLAVLDVTPDFNTVATGGTQQYVVTGRDAAGNVVPVPAGVTWSVVSGGGSIGAANGMFTAGTLVGVFANTIRATSGAFTGFATVSVTSGALASISVAPNPVSVGSGAEVEFEATGRDANGNIVATPSLAWTVQTPAAGTIIAGTGVFTASAATATYANAVRATSGTIFGSATVTVTTPGALAAIIVSPNPSALSAGGTRQFRAAGQDANGAFVTLPAGLTWAVVNGGGSINSTTGMFTASLVSGTYSNTVRARVSGISGFASVTVSAAGPGSGPSLGTAADFAVLGSTAVSCIGVSSIAGNVGVAPAGSVSGFPAPCVIASPGDPVPHINDAVAMIAQADVTPAFNALAAMPCGTSLTGQNLGGMTLAPGVYCFTSSAQLTGTVTLAGPANGLWVFQVGTALTTGTSAQVVLSGGAQARNVFWQVGSSATLGQTTAFRGNIIAGISVTLVQGSTLVGRALSKAGVTLDGNTITLP